MSNFNELIKQKVEQFDAPYNEAHWAEMEGKLNSIKAAKIKQNTLIAVGTVAIIAVSSIFYFNNTNNNTQLAEATLPAINTNTTNITEEKNKTKNSVNTTNTLNNSISQNDTDKTSKIENALIIEENTSEQPEVISSIEEKKYGDNNSISTHTNPIKPTAKFIVFNNKICLGEEVSFEANESTLPVSYFWNFGDGSTSKKQNPNHVYAESGKFDVTLTVVEKKSRIEVKHTEKNAAVILPNPKADFKYIEASVQHDNNKLKYPNTNFNNTETSSKNSYLWRFGNGETDTSPNPKIIYKKNGEFNVSLTVKNHYGCVNSTSKNIEIKHAFDLFAPNAFTPDNDGKNDEFIPKALLGLDVQFEMVVTDVSNNTVYKTSDKNEPWKGSLNNNGSILPAGVYLWKVITYDADGKTHQHVGRVKILD